MARVIPQDEPGTVTVVIAANRPGRIEPFVFEHQNDGERFADSIEGKGEVAFVLVYPGIELLNEHEASSVIFQPRGLQLVESGPDEAE